MWLYYESLFSIYDILLLCLLFRGLAVTPSSLLIQIIWCLAALFSKDLRKKINEIYENLRILNF